jgi:hypothetical protein
MSYPINYPTPQGANVQIFQTGGVTFDWVKPQGASFVWFTLIGAGGAGGNGSGGDFGGGGGSGAVTNFMCPAFLIPDELQIIIGDGVNENNQPTLIKYQQKNGTGYELLRANGGTRGDINATGTGGTAMANNYFTAMGFLNSTNGQDGSSGGIGASSTTFLNGGAASTEYSTTHYGYSLQPNGRRGFFMMQPIIVGLSNAGQAGNGSTRARSANGCGGSGSVSSNFQSLGGDGMAVIITW